MEKKPCLKCLLKEMDEAAYMEKLHRYIEMMDAKSRTADDKYEERLSICKQCDYLEAGTCLACGCYVELRAATKISACPYKKW
ncbi:MAG: hypothetical protein J6C63_00795 [Lachnospiraceae bacterium]|nr:hypothetical protein [Lachnospiraceae bacterium]